MPWTSPSTWSLDTIDVSVDRNCRTAQPFRTERPDHTFRGDRHDRRGAVASATHLAGPRPHEQGAESHLRGNPKKAASVPGRHPSALDNDSTSPRRRARSPGSLALVSALFELHHLDERHPLLPGARHSSCRTGTGCRSRVIQHLVDVNDLSEQAARAQAQ